VPLKVCEVYQGAYLFTKDDGVSFTVPCTDSHTANELFLIDTMVRSSAKFEAACV
jgi:hypothetical protein